MNNQDSKMFYNFKNNDSTGNTDTDSWPMFRHDAANSGHSSCNLSGKNILSWNVKTDIMSSSCPAVVDGMVYVTTGAWWEGQIHCIDLETGLFLWNYTVNDSVWVSPVVAGDYVYVAARGSNIFCLNRFTGTKIWETVINPHLVIFEGSPVLYDGKLYIGCNYNYGDFEFHSRLYCLDSSDGEILWYDATEYESYEYSPAVSNGRIYTMATKNKLCCLDAENGNRIWTLPDYSFYSYPVIINDNIYVKTMQGTVICVKDGEMQWEYFPVVNHSITTSIVANEDNIIFGTGNSKVLETGRVVCLDSETGEEKWNYTARKHHCKYRYKPSMTSGYVYLLEDHHITSSQDATYICTFDVKTGQRIWSQILFTNLNDYVYGGFAIADDKIIFSSVEHDIENGEVIGGVYCYDTFVGNFPPSTPSTNYQERDNILRLISTDPEENKIRYGISWDNDQIVDEWTVFCESGEYAHIICNNKKESVGVIAEDEHGDQSDWVSQKSKPHNMQMLIMRFIKNPSFQIFQKMMNMG